MKAVIFDFNGTLFFDNDKHIQAWGEISKILRGRPIEDEELHAHVNGVPNIKVIQYFLNNNATQDQLNKYSKLKEEIYRKCCKEHKESFHLVKGSYEYFNLLKEQNIPFTIASASIIENINFFVESFELDKYIDPNTIVYDDGTYENKIRMFKEAANILNTNIEDCLIIEDSMSGIKNAYQAGCRNIIVVNSANNRSEFEKMPGVIQVIETFEELLKK